MRAAREQLGLTLAALLVFVTSAFADGSAADEAFKRGRELFKENKFAEACVEFEHSQQLDPQLGTLFNIAQCDAQIGKLASALAAYREVISRDTNPTRRATAADLAAKVEPRIPKLVVQVSGSPAGLAITLDDTRTIAANVPIDVDLGSYRVTVRADGMVDFVSTITIADEARTTAITAELAPGSTGITAKPKKPVHHGRAAPTDEPIEIAPRSHRKLYAIAAIVAGGAAIANGAVFGVLARSKWADAKAVCGGTDCATQDEADRAGTLGAQARTKATTSTILFAAGGVVATIGIVLWATAPTEHAHELALTARATPDGGAVTLVGRF